MDDATFFKNNDERFYERDIDGRFDRRHLLAVRGINIRYWFAALRVLFLASTKD